jgi:hypothetical protein
MGNFKREKEGKGKEESFLFKKWGAKKKRKIVIK